MSWRIRLSAAVKPSAGVIDCAGLSMGANGIAGFTSREAAVAWALRYLDARIVTTASALSNNEPTCFIEPGDA